MPNEFIIKHRRGTLEEWIHSEIVPLEGEIVVELDEHGVPCGMKIGDGTHRYNELDYVETQGGSAPIIQDWDARTVNGHTVESDVPANAKFTDTTYGVVTTQSAGLMTPESLSKLNSIENNANRITKTSELINDSGFVTEASLPNNLDEVEELVSNISNTVGASIENLSNIKADKTEIPTQVSQLVNDAGYLSTEDIVDNLTTDNSNKPLSSKQGQELKALIDNATDALYAHINSNVSTWGGSAIPALNNEPAVNWTDNNIRNSHLGDVYYISSDAEASMQGLSYRFQANEDGYEWVLIQDSAVSLALSRIDKVEDAIASKADNLFFNTDDGKLYLMSEDTIIGDGVTVSIGGGSGGSGGTTLEYTISLTNLLDSRVFTISEGTPVSLQFNYSSVDADQLSDGDGIGRVTINGIVKSTFAVHQGSNTIDVSKIISSGLNTIKVRVENSEGTTKTLTYTVTVVSVSITSKFDVSAPFTGEINFPYVANGSGINKNVHFELDGTIIETVVVATHNREASYIIPAQAHGAHKLRVWFDCIINDTEVISNVLYYEFACVVGGNNTSIIISNTETIMSASQYDTIIIPYRVYTPNSLTTNINQVVDGNTVASLTVDRTEHIWSYRADVAGVRTLRITCGGVYKEWQLTVSEGLIDVVAETNNLSLYLSSYGRSNNEANPAVWEYNNIHTNFIDFNFASDGWQLDDDGVSVLRVMGDARLEIPAYIFATDFRTTGKTIEIEFASRDILNYEAVIISCMSGGRGIRITSQMAELFSEQSSIGTKYKENEHIRISFVVEKRSDNRFLLAYVNGILSSAVIYPDSDGFSQATPVVLSIGSNECTTDLYCIRVYDNNLTRYQILDNWIADTQDGQLMLNRYNRNQVYNEYGEISVNNLPTDLPYMVLESEVLPQFKGDKKTCSGYYVDVLNPARSFSFTGAQIDVQGTSSQYSIMGIALRNQREKTLV